MNDCLSASPKPWGQHLGEFISESKAGINAGGRSLTIVRKKHPGSHLQVARICCREVRAKMEGEVETAKPGALRLRNRVSEAQSHSDTISH